MTKNREGKKQPTPQPESDDALALDKDTLKDLEADASDRDQPKGGAAQLCSGSSTIPVPR